MIDCHIHMVLDSIDWKNAIRRHSAKVDKAFVDAALTRYASLGYTYLRDGGDRWGVGAYARDRAKDLGIVYRTPLAPLSKAGHYGGFIGLQWENLRQFADLVKMQKARGADFLKIMISGLMDFDRFGVLTEEGLDPGQIRELVHIGHEEGLAVMAHANGGKTILSAAEAGVDSIEHGAYAESEALAAMAEMGVVWCPTLSTVGNLRAKGRFDEKAVRAIFDGFCENLQAFSQLGGPVALGTDAGAWAVPHGCDTEKAYLEELGIDWKTGSERIMQKF